MNAKLFFDSLRASGINLTDANVDGLQRVVAYAEEHGIQINRVSYGCGTAFWETGGSCQPVEEGYYLGSSAKVKAFQRKLRYYPFFGRGLVQCTWERNYRAAAKLLGLAEDYFVKYPSKLLQWEYSLPLLFKAMEVGLYTGKGFDDYIDDLDEDDAEDRREYINARRIINGTDRAAKIADLSLKFEKALKAGLYGRIIPPPPDALTEPPEEVVKPDIEPVTQPPSEGLFLRLLRALWAAIKGD
jgi:putative chitinase